jgi:hypothetical protein
MSEPWREGRAKFFTGMNRRRTVGSIQLEDVEVLVEAAIHAGSVRTLLFVAARALGSPRGDEMVGRTAIATHAAGGLVLWTGHWRTSEMLVSYSLKDSTTASRTKRAGTGIIRLLPPDRQQESLV